MSQNGGSLKLFVLEILKALSSEEKEKKKRGLLYKRLHEVFSATSAFISLTSTSSNKGCLSLF